MEKRTSKEFFAEARDMALEAVKSGRITEAEAVHEVDKVIDGGVEISERISVSFRRTEG